MTPHAITAEDGTIVLYTRRGLKITLRPSKQKAAEGAQTCNEVKDEVMDLQPETSLPPPPLSSFPAPLSAYHHLVPYISIAFSDGEYVPCLLPLPAHSPPLIGKHKHRLSTCPASIIASTCTENPFTHVLRILHPTSNVSYRNSRYLHSDPGPNQSCELVPGMTWCDVDRETGVHHLSLVVPLPAALESPRRSSRIPPEPILESHEHLSAISISRTILTDDQLKLARDFLALALPCFPGPQDPAPDPAHVLITVPGVSPLPSMDMFNYTYSLNGMMTEADKRVRAQSIVDVMSVVACFEAYRNSTMDVRGILERLKRGLARAAEDATGGNLYASLGCRQRTEEIHPWMDLPSRLSSQGVSAIRRGICAQSVLLENGPHIRI